jgi:hypothetical protein
MRKLLLALLAAAVVAGGYVLLAGDHGIPVAIVTDKTTTDGQQSTRTRWYARDRARIEIAAGGDTLTWVVRLDKGEVWFFDPKKKTCTIRAISQLKTEMYATNDELLARARKDPAWGGDLGDLSRHLSGDYEVRVVKEYTDNTGRRIREVAARVGNVFRCEMTLAWDKRIPRSAHDIGLAYAMVFGAEGGLGASNHQWLEKLRELGNLTLRSELRVRLPGTSMVGSTTDVTVVSKKVKKDLFEVPSGYEVRR